MGLALFCCIVLQDLLLISDLFVEPPHRKMLSATDPLMYLLAFQIIVIQLSDSVTVSSSPDASVQGNRLNGPRGPFQPFVARRL